MKKHIEMLEYKLRIPKLQREFLESKGALDNFIQAKKSGQSELAKWTLLQSGKGEIDRLVLFNKGDKAPNSSQESRRPSRN